MKIRFHLFLYMLCVLLSSSCATATVAITPTASITQAAPLVAPSPVTSHIPFPAAFPSPESSPTSDPRFGLPPTVDEGYTLDKDIPLLMYTETDTNGHMKYWSNIKSWNDPESVTGHWFTLHVLNGSLNGGIPLLVHNDDPYGAPDMIPLYVFVPDNINMPYIKHTDGPANTESLTGLLSQYIGTRYANDTYGTGPTADTWTEIRTKIEQGQLSISFSGPAGSFEFKPSQKVGAKIFVIPWKDADPTKDSRFVELAHGFGPTDNTKLRSMTLGDDEGWIDAWVASENPAETADQIREEVLFAVVRVIVDKNQSLASYNAGQRFSNVIASVFKNAGKGPDTPIDIAPNP